MNELSLVSDNGYQGRLHSDPPRLNLTIPSPIGLKDWFPRDRVLVSTKFRIHRGVE